MDLEPEPRSPLHPAADEENPIETSTIPNTLSTDLALDDDEDTDEVEESAMSVDQVGRLGPDPSTEFLHSDSMQLLNNPLNCNIPRDPNYTTPMSDFSDPTPAPFQPINPFGANSLLSSSEPIKITLSQSEDPRKLSDAQQERLVNYLDNSMMKIHRGFVKYLSSVHQDANESEKGLNLIEMLFELNELTEFIWFSITGHKNIPVIYHANVHDLASQTETTAHVTLPNDLPNGQGFINYYLTIMSDLVDFLGKYKIGSWDEWRSVLGLLGKLDDLLCILVDYDKTVNIKGLISSTEKIRMASIVQLTKMGLIGLFDEFVRSFDRDNIASQRETIQYFEVLIGEVYEGLVDRTSI